MISACIEHVRSLRILPLSALILFQAAASAVHGGEDERSLGRSFDLQVKPFLKQYCERCHNEEKRTSGIRVDHLDRSLEDRQLKLWDGIRKQLASEAMPPEDEPQPSAADRKRVSEWITQALELARSRPTPKNGGARRLTVAQYRNTLRELLLLEDDLTEVLPPDAVSRDGFVNNQETLALSPLLIEAYFEIAEQALDRCIVDPKSRPRVQYFRVDLGAGINPQPCPDKLILGANSLLLDNRDFVVTQPRLSKPFDFEPIAMRTKYRFIEGYAGNDTVRGWREYDSIYHAVFACMRGTPGYPKGLPYSTVPQGLLLRPAITNDEVFQGEGTYGPRANFKISLRELPDRRPVPRHRDRGEVRRRAPARSGRGGTIAGERQARSSAAIRPRRRPSRSSSPASIRSICIPRASQAAGRDADPGRAAVRGEVATAGVPGGPARRRRAPGPKHECTGPARLDRIVLTPLAAGRSLARRFAAFEQRSPRLGVHLGLRRDCGSTLSQVGAAQTVSNETLSRFVFEGAIRNFPSPDVEKDNVNYLAGVREIGVRSEYTDGRDMPRLLIRSVEFEGPFYDAWPPAIASQHLHRFGSEGRPAGLRAPDHPRLRHPRVPPPDHRPGRVLSGGRLRKVVQGRGEISGQREGRAAGRADVAPVPVPDREQHARPHAEPLDDYELASKLSYFLWNGPPDRETLKLAAAGSLHERLDAEVERMIDDPRFARFAGEFASQWLALDKFQVLEPDRSRFPRLTRDTRTQLRQEPVQFVQYLIRNNLPARNLIESDFIVANEVVASYYDLADRTESGFQFVRDPARAARAGRRPRPGGDPGGAVGRPRVEPGEARRLARAADHRRAAGRSAAERAGAQGGDEATPAARAARAAPQPARLRPVPREDRPVGNPARGVRRRRPAEAAAGRCPFDLARQDRGRRRHRPEAIPGRRPHRPGRLQRAQASRDLRHRPHPDPQRARVSEARRAQTEGQRLPHAGHDPVRREQSDIPGKVDNGYHLFVARSLA